MVTLKNPLYRLGAWILGSALYRRTGLSHYHVSGDLIAYLRRLGAGEVKTIVDAGARYGDMALLMRRHFKRASIYALEPLPSSFEMLKRKTGHDPHIMAVNRALSDRSGRARLNINRFDATSSVLPSRHTGSALDELCKTEKSVDVTTITLDEFAGSESLESIDLLKLDIQGSELRALMGAKNLLAQKKIRLILTEVLFMKIYDQQPYFHDISAYLYSCGYQLRNLINPWYVEDRMAWADAVFSWTSETS